jgi:hypothetical protein
MTDMLTGTCGPLSGTSVKRGFVTFVTVVLTMVLALTEAPAEEKGRTAPGHSVEGKLESFLGKPKLDIQQVYKGGRFPNILVAVDGTVLALWGGVKVRRSEDGGRTWGPEIMVANGFMGGGTIVNETNREILAFIEKNHPPAPLTVYRSRDHGKTWLPMESVIKPDANGNVPSMHTPLSTVTTAGKPGIPASPLRRWEPVKRRLPSCLAADYTTIPALIGTRTNRLCGDAVPSATMAVRPGPTGR